MKKLILLALVLFSAATMLAQTNRMSYQAVVRNAANELVAEENLTVAIRISDANSTSAFSETHSVTSNRNGVISLMIGEGSGQSGNMASVDWRTAQIHTEVTLPGGATLSNTTLVNAVPYAFYADSVDIHWVNDVVDEYLENHDISSIVETDPTVPAWAKEATKPVYDYSEITNTPDMSGYLTSETDPTVPDWAKESVKPVYDYSEITNTPDMTPYLTIESDPTVNNSTITIQQNGDLVGSFTLNQASDQTINITVPTSGGGGSVPQTLNISGNVITLSDGGGSVTLPAETDPTVPDWAKESVKPIYDYSEITNTPDMTPYLTIESDPTVPAWAKESVKPVYDYSEITNTPDMTPYLTTESDPTVNDGTLTITLPDGTSSTFTANQGGNTNVVIPAMSVADLLALVGGMTDAEKEALRDALGVTGGTALTEPTVTTSGATDVTEASATLNGSISNPDNVAITAQGFEWKATAGGAYVAVNATGETMTYNLTGLTAGTSYTYRAFVTTAEGTSYGETVSFTTIAAGGGAVEGDAIPCPGTPTVTDHEGNVYATVQIGSQCWMRDNLRTTTSPSTGTYLIPAANANYTYTGKMARWYNNDSATYAPMNYGLLYNWNAAVDTFNTAYGETSVNISSSNAVSVTFSGHRRGICPAGWHLPSDAEWTQLTNYVGSQSEYTCSGYSNYIAKALASTEGWNSYSGECYPGDQSVTANNATGFSAVPAGNCNGSSFYGTGFYAYFWSATQDASGPIYAYDRNLGFYSAGVGRSGSGKYYCRSVRCLRD